MSAIAGKRAFAVTLATLLAVVACYTVLARDAKAAVRPASDDATSVADEGKVHRPVIGSGVKFVRNADGSVTQTR